MKISILRACGVVAIVAGIALPQQMLGQRDPVLGTWKLNVEKSKYDPGPRPKNSTLIYEAAGQGVKVRASGVGAQGQPTGVEYTASYDGQDYPVKLIGTPDYDTVAQEGRQSRPDIHTGRLAGWKDPDGHDHGHERAWPADQHRRGVREVGRLPNRFTQPSCRSQDPTRLALSS